MEAPHQNMELPKTNHTNINGEHVILMPDQATAPPLKQTEPTLTRTKTVRSLNFSKPKARFSEVVTNYYQHHKTIPQTPNNQHHQQPLSPQDETDEEEYDWFDDEEELDNDDEQDPLKKYRKRRKINKRALIEWSLFVLIMACLITSLLVKTKENNVFLGLEIWKWCLMVLVVFSGRLVSGWVVGFLVFLIERNFMLREKVLYFVYGLRKSFQNCAWLGLVLVAWVIMFPNNSHKDNKIMKRAFRGLVAILIGATIWLLKIVFVKVLASSFHVTTFFDRMKESVFHHYVLDALSGPPLEAEEVAAMNNNNNNTERRRSSSHAGMENNNFSQTPSLSSLKSKRWGARRIDMEKLKKLSYEKRPTAWSLKRLVNFVRFSGLSTISTTVDDFAKAESVINSEWEARTCAKRIFRNVAKPGAKYIEEEDLLRFLKSEEVYTIFPLFEGALETGRITKNSFKNWVVHAYIERKALAHSLNDTKTAVQQLHKLASAVVIVIIIVVSLLVMGLATTKVIFVVTSQLLLVGFMFQNTCKTMFESIIFVFVMHPFDVGDRCVVDDVQMIVEEMNILSTVFLKFDMEKIYYPNSVLLTKPISNFRRSPEMSDSIEFSIDVSTSFDDINALKKAIQTYIESKPNHWVPKHSVLVKEIVNVNKMTMGLYVQHTMNHQNFGEKSSRRSELLLELKRIFEKLGIEYHLLPQEIILTHRS